MLEGLAPFAERLFFQCRARLAYAFPRLRWEKEVRLIGEQPTNSTVDHGIASVMPAWTAGIQVRKDASGHIHVNLGSGAPCRNDEIEEYSPKLTKFKACEQPNTEEPLRDLARYDKHVGFSFWIAMQYRDHFIASRSPSCVGCVHRPQRLIVAALGDIVDGVVHRFQWKKARRDVTRIDDAPARQLQQLGKVDVMAARDA
jgi:hypothetical protein